MSISPVRVLIVDDSAIVRRLLTSALSSHPEVEVVGSAANGLIALSKVPQLSPELLILDIEMPEMDGMATLRALRESYPRLPVIMFSTLTERGASVTFDALAAGADDYVLKPSTQTGDTLESIVANTMLPKIIGLTRSRLGLALQAALSAVEVDLPPDTKTLRGLRPSTSATSPRGSLPSGSLLTPPSVPTSAADLGANKLGLRVALPNSAGANLRPQLGAPARNVLTGDTRSPLSNPPPARGSFPSSPTTGLQALAASRTASADPPSKLTTMLKPQPVVRGSSPRAITGPTVAGARKPAQVVVIAASTGGPNALAEILPRLPGALSVPIVIVQHMPALFTRCLADRLSSRSELRVTECQGGERLSPGHVYIAPGNRHLEVARDAEGVRVLLTDGAPENSCRPAADVTMRSIARAYGASTLAVVLTGMGHDGLRGARDICEAGGRVIVQSGPTCVIWGMPKAVEEAGIAEAVVPLLEVAAAILLRVGSGLMPVRDPGVAR